jgi:hypothetical protein
MLEPTVLALLYVKRAARLVWYVALKSYKLPNAVTDARHGTCLNVGVGFVFAAQKIILPSG